MTINNIRLWLSNTDLGQAVYPVWDMNRKYIVMSCEQTGRTQVQKTGTYFQCKETLLECVVSLCEAK